LTFVAGGMGNMDRTRGEQLERGTSDGYEPPRVERVLTPAELEQEILYAGQDASLPA
jgi:hypothetical protein